jgi:hypothetical protein
MRVLVGFAISMAAIVLALSGAGLGQAEERNVKSAQPPSNNAKETRLSLEDIRILRGKHTSSDKIVEMAAEQGREFEVTADVESGLRKIGFSAAQITAIKDASPDPLVPGKWLSSTDADRDAYMELMRKVAIKSGAAIEPVASQHVTLWAAKAVQETYLADLRKAEKFFHTKCAEPIRSGLDKRTAHVVVLSNRAEYAAWWRVMLELDEKLFEVKDNPGYREQMRQDVFKCPGLDTACFSVVCAGEFGPDWARRSVAGGVGNQYLSQLTRPPRAVQMGFASWTETAVLGFPGNVAGEVVYGQEPPLGFVVGQDWAPLVKQRMTARKATPPAELLKADKIIASQELSAERWSLVGLLNQQPVKFGKLLTSMKQGDADPVAGIEKIYGWDEKELSRQWRVYGLSLGKRTAPVKAN